jgi:hypothetical protein
MDAGMKLKPTSSRQGVLWVRLGIATFWRQPIAMAGMFFMFMGLMTLASMLPLVGGALALVLFPSGSLGLMTATQEATQGRFPRPKWLLVGWTGSPGLRQQMFVLGVLYTLGFVLVLLLSALADGGAFAHLYLLGGRLDNEVLEQPGFQAAIWLAMLFYLPLSALFWHAPALVYWHGVPAIKSLFFSITACLANWRAMLVYMVCWSALYAAAGLSLMIVASLMGDSGSVGAALVPIMLMITAMFFCSAYFTYRDSFD